MIIAVDGPAAAGKGTLARAIAEHFGLAYLDTGALYRAVALRVIEAGGDPADPEAAAKGAESLQPGDTENARIRDEDVARGASLVSAVPEVRRALLTYQRHFAANPPGGAPGAVVDGRDIGTVVLPDADHKLFVTASDEARARRRAVELETRGEKTPLSAVLEDMRARDARDREREISPLTQAEDALLLETTNLDIDNAFAAALALIAEDQAPA